MLKISPKGEVKGTTLTDIHARTPDILGFWVAASSQSLCCSPTLRSGVVGSAPCHQKGKMKKHVTIEVLFSLKKNLVYFLKGRYQYKTLKLFYGTCCCNRYCNISFPCFICGGICLMSYSLKTWCVRSSDAARSIRDHNFATN